MSMGFKKEEAATTCVNYILNQTSQNTREGFLDLSAAFDNVNITKLLQIQQGMKIEEEICVWNHNCLVGTTLMIKQTTLKSPKKSIRGSQKDPTNFILYTTK
jgi:isocitrate lyase